MSTHCIALVCDDSVLGVRQVERELEDAQQQVAFMRQAADSSGNKSDSEAVYQLDALQSARRDIAALRTSINKVPPPLQGTMAVPQSTNVGYHMTTCSVPFVKRHQIACEVAWQR